MAANPADRATALNFGQRRLRLVETVAVSKWSFLDAAVELGAFRE